MNDHQLLKRFVWITKMFNVQILGLLSLLFNFLKILHCRNWTIDENETYMLRLSLLSVLQYYTVSV